MKALVLGCGSIGFRHIGHLRQLGLSDLEAADPDPAVRDRVRQRYGLLVHESAEDALERRPEMVLVCTPAATHVPLTLQALEAGAHVFVEKPLSTTLDGTEELAKAAESAGRFVQVGYNLRYHPAVQAAKRLVEEGRLGKVLLAHAEFGLYLERWWPGRDYRTSYLAKPEQGDSLLLDASHEIDLLLWLLGPVQEVTGAAAKLSGLEIRGVDAIKAVMTMANGCLASLHIDCLQPVYTRGFTLTGEGTGLKWDCPDGRADTTMGQLMLCDRESTRYAPVHVEGQPQDLYVEELRDFVKSVESGKPPWVGLAQGIEVLRVAAAIEQAVKVNGRKELHC